MDTRNQILLKAREQFSTHGYTGVTMEALARHLGMSKKTLYENFPSKDGLAEAVLERYICNALSRYETIMNSPLDYTDKLSNVLCLFGNMLTQMGKRYQEELRVHRPDLWQRVADLRDRAVFDDFRSFIDSGIRQGILRADINRDEVLQAYLKALQGVLDSNRLVNSSFSVAQSLASVAKSFLDGILTERAKGDVLNRHEYAMH